jgi:hypothetical protein
MNIVCHKVLRCLKQRQNNVPEVAAKVIDYVTLQFLQTIGYLYDQSNFSRMTNQRL